VSASNIYELLFSYFLEIEKMSYEKRMVNASSVKIRGTAFMIKADLDILIMKVGRKI
jgi:hypothetical protein